MLSLLSTLGGLLISLLNHADRVTSANLAQLDVEVGEQGLAETRHDLDDLDRGIAPAMPPPHRVISTARRHRQRS